MSLTLYYHPLASYCWKALIALYEAGAGFEPRLVDLGNDASRSDFLKVWPIGKFPVLRDEARDQTVPEATVIIEYLQLFYPGPTRFIPDDPDAAWQTRLQDRFFDLYVHEHMQRVVADRLRPAGSKDPMGVAHAKAMLQTAYGLLDRRMASRQWAMGPEFGLADCAASPALYYANRVQPLGSEFPNVAAYLDRLMKRPSFARVLQEAQPYFAMFPEEK
jgi:glutathione S-transferase